MPKKNNFYNRAQKVVGSVDDKFDDFVDAGGNVSSLLQLLGDALGRFEKLSLGAEGLFKPLEVLTAFLSVTRAVVSRINLERRKGKDVLSETDYQSKKNKRDVLAFLGLVTLGLSMAVFASTGVGLVAMYAGMSVVSSLKLFYVHHRTAQALKAKKSKLELKGLSIKSLLAKDHPTTEDLGILAKKIDKYLKVHHQISRKQEKQQERKIEMVGGIIVGVAFIVAAAFPPLIVAMVAVGLGVMGLNAGRKIFGWVKRKYSKSQTSTHVEAEKKKILDELVKVSNLVPGASQQTFEEKKKAMSSQIVALPSAPSPLRSVSSMDSTCFSDSTPLVAEEKIFSPKEILQAQGDLTLIHNYLNMGVLPLLPAAESQSELLRESLAAIEKRKEIETEISEQEFKLFSALTSGLSEPSSPGRGESFFALKKELYNINQTITRTLGSLSKIASSDPKVPETAVAVTEVSRSSRKPRELGDGGLFFT